MLKYTVSAGEGFLKAIQRLEKLGANLDNRKLPFLKAAIYLQGSVLKNFRAQGRPNSWAPLAPLTLALRRSGRGGGSPRILQDTGRLMNSILPWTADDSFGVGTNVSYARLMQEGGMSEPSELTIPEHVRHITQAFGKALKSPVIAHVREYVMKIGAHRVPARPFLVIQQEDASVIANIFRGYIQDLLANG